MAVGGSLSLLTRRKNHQFADYLISVEEIIGLNECLIRGGIRHVPRLFYAVKALVRLGQDDHLDGGLGANGIGVRWLGSASR